MFLLRDHINDHWWQKYIYLVTLNEFYFVPLVVASVLFLVSPLVLFSFSAAMKSVCWPPDDTRNTCLSLTCTPVSKTGLN